jgi:hypothetical protein
MLFTNTLVFLICGFLQKSLQLFQVYIFGISIACYLYRSFNHKLRVTLP